MNELYEKLYGCLMGGAAGEALTGEIKTAGCIGDVIKLECCLIKSFLYKRKRLTANDVVKLIRKRKADSLYPALAAVAGLSDCAAPELAYNMAYELIYTTRKRERESGALYAGLIALAMEPNADIETVILNAEQLFKLDLIKKIKRVRTRMITGEKILTAELIYVALALIEDNKDDIEHSIRTATELKIGAQLTAILTGQLTGALYGLKKLSTEHITLINDSNTEILKAIFDTEKAKTFKDISALLFYALRVMCDAEQKRWNEFRGRLGDINGDIKWNGLLYQSLNEEHRPESHIVI